MCISSEIFPTLSSFSSSMALMTLLPSPTCRMVKSETHRAMKRNALKISSEKYVSRSKYCLLVAIHYFSLNVVKYFMLIIFSLNRNILYCSMLRPQRNEKIRKYVFNILVCIVTTTREHCSDRVITSVPIYYSKFAVAGSTTSHFLRRASLLLRFGKKSLKHSDGDRNIIYCPRT